MQDMFDEGSKLLLCLKIRVYLVTVLDWLVVAVYYMGQELFQHDDSNYLQHVNDTDFNYLLWKAHLTTSCLQGQMKIALFNNYYYTSDSI